MFLDSRLAIIIYFVVSKIVFIILHQISREQRKIRLFLFEIGLSSLYIGLNIPILKINSSIYLNTVIGIIFVLFSFGVRKLTVKDKPWLGIIDFVWICVFGCLITIFLSRNEITVYYAAVEEYAHNKNALMLFHDEIKFYIDKIVLAILTFGSVLAVAMTILWRGGVWQVKHKNNQISHYRGTTRTAICIAFGFLSISVSTLNWLLYPLLSKLDKIKIYI